MDAIAQDLRYALRRLVRSPGFAVVAVVTLALGIGANSAIFSVVNAVLLRALPFAESERLMLLYTGYPDDQGRYPLSAPDFMSVQEAARSFEGVVAVAAGERTRTERGEPARVRVGAVTRDFFEVLGVTPLTGRVFAPDEHLPGQNEVALLGHAHWREQYGGTAEVLGMTVTLNGVQHTIVGVLPPQFDFPDEREVYLPVAYGETFDATTATGRRSEYLMTVGRLASGVDPEQAALEVRQISDRLQQEFPITNSSNITLSISPLRQELLGETRRPLLVLLGAVGLVLLIACVNVANLLLARAAARSGEIAVRAALGARRGRLVRQLLTESVVLAAVGGGAGLLVAVLATRVLVAAGPEGIPRLGEVGVDGTVVTFTAGLALVTALLFGLLPALHSTRTELSGTIREGSRGGTAPRSAQLLRRLLVVAQMALAVVLLVGAGLLLRSFARLTAVDPGFRAERLVTFTLSLPPTTYPDGESVRQFYPRVLERLQSVPGVERVAAGSGVPLGGLSTLAGFSIENREPTPGFVMDAGAIAVTPGYFETFDIPLRSGRLLTDGDDWFAPDVVVVNEAFVRRYFPDTEPIGRRISFGGDDWTEIVGVVADAPQSALGAEVRAAIYSPHEQYTTRTLTIGVRTGAALGGIASAIRYEIGGLDPDLPIQRLTTGEEIVARSLAGPRFYTTLLGTFAALALILAAVGIFGVMSYLVSQRTREIGVRMALGADASHVRRLIVIRAGGLAAVGVAVGLVAATAGSRLLVGLLFEVGTLDPVAYVGAGALLLGVALAAGYLPARAASRLDPLAALRAD